MNDAEFILDAARDEELVGVDHYPYPAAVIIEAEFEDRQATLRGDRDADLVGEREPAGGGKLLLGQEIFGEVTQSVLLRVVERGEKRQCRDHRLPKAIRYRCRFPATTQPAEQLADHAASTAGGAATVRPTRLPIGSIRGH